MIKAIPTYKNYNSVLKENYRFLYIVNNAIGVVEKNVITLTPGRGTDENWSAN